MEEFKIGGQVTIDELLNKNKNFEITKKSEMYGNQKVRIEYIDGVVSGFDTEASSTLDSNGSKVAMTYAWMFGINGDVVLGRTWSEFLDCMEKVVEHYQLGPNRRLIIYVHNLPYDFQFFRKLFNWTTVFATEKRSVLKAVSTTGLEFRCSYILAGCSLDTVGKNLTKYKVRKMVGDLDYSLLRTPETPLTEKEIGYCIHDVLVLMAYIREELEYYKKITKIPLTNTGKVREYCRNKCLSQKNYVKYRNMISKLTIDGINEYDMLKRAFQGGFTHSNKNNTNKVFTDVHSYDFTSSYPSVIIAYNGYPMSAGCRIKIKDEKHYRDLIKNYCVICNVRFIGIREKVNYENYISTSKCYTIQNPKVNNGRLISAEMIDTTITEIDFSIIEQNYEWDEVKFGYCYYYKRGYLPKEILECVLDFYGDKTTLKDVPGMEVEYQLKKGMLNSIYGCMVQDPLNEEVLYEDDEWDTEINKIYNNDELSDKEKDCVIDTLKIEKINKYNDSKKRFLFYPWGIYVTAFARRNLWYGINELKNDYIYSDTDSVKFVNIENHKDFFDRYNKWIVERIKKSCADNKLDVNKACPKTIKGKEKPMGVFDYEGMYDTFKTLGAKRYLVEHKQHIVKTKHITTIGGFSHLTATIAGVNKSKGSLYLEMLEDPFEEFTDKLTFPEDFSGRLISTYIDDTKTGICKDYLGNEYQYHELSGIHMSKSDYNLTLSPIYLALIGATEASML